MPLPVEPPNDTLLGKYQVLKRIGMGGMAEVFHGRHEKLNRDVAIKILHSSLAEDPQFIARFEREARLAATLRHPGIVQVYDFDTQGDHLYLVMEYINGGTLKQRLETVKVSGGFLPLNEVTRLISLIASALDYAHSRNMLHRDLKPSNILLDQASMPYLTDFGIARFMGSSEITRTGSILGTPAYMSPEQCEGKSLSASSDLYSFGIILFEMLTNTVPFEAESPLAVLQKQIHDPIPSVADYRSDLPVSVDTFLHKALAKEPEERFSTAAKMAESFLQLLKDSGMEYPPSDLTHSSSVTPDGYSPKAGKTKGNWSIGWLLAIAFGVLLLVTAGILIWTARQTNMAAIRRCTTPATCETAGRQLAEANRLVLAVEAYDKAASLVPSAEQTQWAKLKCDQGDLYSRINKPVEAVNTYRECINWTHNDALLADLRLYARQKLKEMN